MKKMMMPDSKMNNFTMLKKSVIVLLISMIFILLSCFNVRGSIKDVIENEKYNFDKFKDSYTDNIYTNESLGMTITFDSNWDIQTQYDDFQNLTKKYAQLIVSKSGEVIFVGFNNEKQLGVRAVCEIRDLSDDEYLKKLKAATAKDVADYKIKFVLEKKESLEYIEGIHIVSKVTINRANKFAFDSFVFSKNNANLKIDFWCQTAIYEQEKEYIKNIFNSINITTDTTTDITKSSMRDSTSDYK